MPAASSILVISARTHFNFSCFFSYAIVFFLIERSSLSADANATDGYKPLPSGGSFLLGQDQDSPEGGFNADQAFSGQVAQVGLWDRMLTEEEILLLAQCKSNLQVAH